MALASETLTPGGFEAFTALRARIEASIPRKLTDAEVLRMSIATAMRDPQTIVTILFCDHVRRELAHAIKQNRLTSMHAIGITPEEYGAIFGINAVQATSGIGCTNTRQIEAEDPALGTTLHQLRTDVLRMTLTSPHVANGWDASLLRCACATALHVSDPNHALEQLLGELSRSDGRRLHAYLEKIRERETSSDAHLVSLCAMIRAISNDALRVVGADKCQ